MKFKMEQGTLHDLLKAAHKATGRDEGLLEFKDSGWMLKCKSEDTVIIFVTKVPDSEMEEYERGGVDTLGFRFNQFLKFLGTNDNTVTFETHQTSAGVNKLRASKGNKTAEIPLVDSEFIEGVPDTVPSLEWPVHFSGDVKFIKKFINDARNITGKKGAYFVSPREGMLYLYSSHDDSRYWESFHWEDFDDYDIDWSEGDQEKDLYMNPPEDKAMDSMFSLEWSNDLYFMADEGRVSVGNHKPMRIVFNTGNDIRAAYIIAPRLPTKDNKTATLPEDIIEKRGLETA